MALGAAVTFARAPMRGGDAVAVFAPKAVARAVPAGLPFFALGCVDGDPHVGGERIH